MLFRLCFLVFRQCVSELWPPLFAHAHTPKYKILFFLLIWKMEKNLLADPTPVTSPAFVVAFIELHYCEW